MNRFRLEALKREFPFLKEIVGDNIPDFVRIKRADGNLMGVTPRYSCHDGSMGITEEDKKVHFVLNDGTVITDAVKQSGRTSSNYAHTQTKEWEGESIIEGIDRHGVAGMLTFIVVEYYYIYDWEGGQYERAHKFTIYKTPKGTSFGEEIKKARAQALAEVRAEADF